MRMVFMGTPEFAAVILEAVAAAGHEVAAVITQPDRPKGRGNKLAPPPVKEKALAMGLPVYQPQSVKNDEFLAFMRELAPEIAVVVAYGRILPQAVLDVPPHGCLNVHGSLLPQYRGAAPIQRAILDGCRETGVTIMRLDAGMDTGDMLAKRAVAIADGDTTGTLFAKLAVLGGELLVETLAAVAAGAAAAEPQDHSQATYAAMLDKADEAIDWRRGAREIHNQVRGLAPSPGAYTWWQGQRLKIGETAVAAETGSQGQPGMVLAAEADGWLVQAGDGAVLVRQVQPAGKKMMPAKAYGNGAGIKAGSQLGNSHE